MTYQFERFTPECQKKLRLIELTGLASQLSKSTDCQDAFQLAEFCHYYAAIHVDMIADRFPKPLKLGGRLYWPEHIVDDYLMVIHEAGCNRG